MAGAFGLVGGLCRRRGDPRGSRHPGGCAVTETFGGPHALGLTH